MNQENFSIPDLAALSFAFVLFGVILIVGIKALSDNFKERNK